MSYFTQKIINDNRHSNKSFTPMYTYRKALEVSHATNLNASSIWASQFLSMMILIAPCQIKAGILPTQPSYMVIKNQGSHRLVASIQLNSSISSNCDSLTYSSYRASQAASDSRLRWGRFELSSLEALLLLGLCRVPCGEEIKASQCMSLELHAFNLETSRHTN